MGRQIIKQPNGKYSIYSSVVDGFIYENLTLDEYIDIHIEEESYIIRKNIKDIGKQIDRGDKPYHQYTLTYEEAKEFHEQNYIGIKKLI